MRPLITPALDPLGLDRVSVGRRGSPIGWPGSSAFLSHWRPVTRLSAASGVRDVTYSWCWPRRCQPLQPIEPLFKSLAGFSRSRLHPLVTAYAVVTDVLSLHVRTCTPRFCISGTAWPIVFKFGVWVWSHYLSVLHKSWVGCIRTCLFHISEPLGTLCWN